MSFISISIDLCGSTKVKQELVEISHDDETARKALYKRYLDLLFQIERDLYTILKQSKKIELKKLYLAKLIGDEFWFLYDIGDDAKNKTTTFALIGLLLELLGKERFLSFHENNGQNEINESRTQATMHAYDLPLKIYMDVIEDASELSTARYEYLKDIIHDFAHQPNEVVYSIDKDLLAIYHQLNLGYANSFDTSSFFSRPDFIGIEVDRFFRLTKQCYPQLLTIGQKCAELLDLKLINIQDEHRQIDVKKALINDTINNPELFAIEKLIPSIEMKGLSHDYQIFYLFNRRVFKDALYAPEIGLKSLLEDTRAFLAKNGYFAVHE